MVLNQNNNVNSFVIPSMGKCIKLVDTWEIAPFTLAHPGGRSWGRKNAYAKLTGLGLTRSPFAKNEVSIPHIRYPKLVYSLRGAQSVAE